MTRILVLLVCLAAASAAQAQPLLRISTENPAEHVQTRVVAAFVERVRACCADRIDVEHRFGTQLFRDRDVLAALSVGKVGMAVPGTWQLDRHVPDMGVFMLPILYGRDERELTRIQDGPVVEALSRQIEDALGVVVLGRWLAFGQANIFIRGRPVADVAELDGLRIRSPGGGANEWRLAALGAKPLTIAWADLLHVLRDGRVDGLLTTFATLDAADAWRLGGWSVLEDRESYSLFVPLVSDYVWRGLDDATRADLRAAWEAGVEEGRAAMRRAQSDARARALAAGVRIATPTAARGAEVRAGLMARQPDIARRLGIDGRISEAVAAALEAP